MSIRMRHTRGHTNNRRSHHALVAASVMKDAESGALRLPHRLDETTGMYRGRQIAPAPVARTSGTKATGPVTAPQGEAGHDHTHEHHDAEVRSEKGEQGKVATGGRPKRAKKSDAKD